MKTNTIFLRIFILGVLAMFLIAGNANAAICTCSDCTTCTDALNNNNCDTVKLTADINNQTGACINDPANFTNKIFDCQGHVINGTGNYGIYLNDEQNSTTRNCLIHDFYNGIYIESSSNNTLSNNTASSNYYGIYIESSSNNTLLNNTASSNTHYGIYLDYSLNNTLLNNTASSNLYLYEEGYGIYLDSSSNNTLSNNTANSNTYGIYLFFSSNNTLSNNTANSNTYGIYLWSSSNNTLSNNTANSNTYGIYLFYSSNNNTLSNNTANSNSDGIYLFSSSNNTLKNNKMNNNTYNFNIGGGEVSNYYQDIDASNLVDEKPMYYWTNKKNAPNNCRNLEINESSNAGFIGLVSCDNITVKNLNLTKNGYGILLVNTTKSKILNNTAGSNTYGIRPSYSSNNTLSNNSVNSNNYGGIYIDYSSNNTLSNNSVNSNYGHGIYLRYSSNNTLSNNSVNSNYGHGIYLRYSSNNTLSNNTANSNTCGIYLDYSSNNTLSNNSASSNSYLYGYGIYLHYSSNNTLSNNSLNSNKNDGIYLDYSSNNTLSNNTAGSNTHGIYLDYSSNNTLSNNTAGSNTHGIYLDSSSNNTLSNNNANLNDYGIYLDSSSNNTLLNNNANLNDYGIYLWPSSNNTLSNNIANLNSHGIYIYDSSNNTLKNNTMNNNTLNFNIEGWEISHYYHDIDASNLVDNKPIYYWTNEKNAPNNCRNLEINELNNAGFVGLISCDNITVKNLNLINNYYGILLVNTINSKILNNTASSNKNGIHLYLSSNNTLSNNSANSNNYGGIGLWYSSNNTLSNNSVNSNYFGIYLWYSSNNVLSNNSVNSNKYGGIYLESSSNNVLSNNTANSNKCGISLWSSSNNTLSNSSTSLNTYGILLSSSSNNTLSNNTVNSNKYGIDLSWYSSNNILANNTANSNNQSGIYLDSSSNNTLINNTVTGNQYGIYSYNSNSTINSNFFCGNINLDFNSTNWLSSSGDNNACNNSDGWNDTGTIGCSNPCGATTITYSIPLNYGWNLVSIPITPKNTSIKSVLASVEGSYMKVGAWTDGTGKHYIPGFPFNTLTDINEEMGFWIKMNQTGTLTVEGYDPEDRKIPLQTGWNLVGYLSTNKTQPLTNALSSINGKYTKVGAWINGTGKHYIPGFPFNTLINISEGYGYWIKMNSTGVLEYDSNLSTNERKATADMAGTINSVVNANNQFAFDIYSEFKDKEGNIFFSPYSISTALAMTYEGARGKTAEEMQSVLHFPEDNITRRAGFSEIINQINKKDKKYELHTANALWAQKDYKFLDEYFKIVEQYYCGEVTNLDFVSDTENSRITINKWVENQTNNKIKDLIPQGVLDDMTRLVLTNAIYFKGTWVKQFDKNNTKEADFRTSPEKTVKVQMMSSAGNEARFNYTETEELQILELPYEGNDLSMLILLPKDDNLKLIEESISAKNLSEWKNNLEEKQVDVYLPKFKFETKYFLSDTLKEMGMPTAFSWPGADFSGMDGTHLLYIKEVIHQAFVEVNEEGTEAAAATGVVVGATCMPDIKVFTADHPFIFIIQEKETGNILFLGRVTDPNKS